jgi:hypothetical protein
MRLAITPIFASSVAGHSWVSITPLRLDLTDEKDLARFS